MEKVNIQDKFSLFTDHWSPKIGGSINDMHVKFTKLKGEFVWHQHEEEDEMFLVIKGSLLMQLRDKDITINEGEFLIVPKGVEHRPVAEEEAHVLLFEPNTTLNTGTEVNERTVSNLESI
ncbi:cupin domain-containing protein [Planococcus lenghuensis]|uniref:Mannose-6-phosphate isomerase n=1 Tax=Planococcus lenghuensis TaxID=2213202 RepID=A0A1Q2KWC3_9BACL|nr:cupin domain-containing protein [Planococcus lenghuensis]AQQ52518.1 mannose-6-phosphate isomerase [Planococcus lenghuensis]